MPLLVWTKTCSKVPPGVRHAIITIIMVTVVCHVPAINENAYMPPKLNYFPAACACGVGTRSDWLPFPLLRSSAGTHML